VLKWTYFVVCGCFFKLIKKTLKFDAEILILIGMKKAWRPTKIALRPTRGPRPTG